jgi:hypothetical protein
MLMVMFISFVCSGTNSAPNSCVPAQMVLLISSFSATTMAFRVLMCIFKTCCGTGIDSWIEAVGGIRRVRL